MRPEIEISVDGRDNGGVAFHGWNQNEVKVVAMIQVNADDDNQSAAIAKQIRINTSGGRISAEGPSMQRRGGWSVSYEIYVPTRSNLDAITRNGGVSAEDVEGELDFQATNGGIRVDNVAGDVRGETTNGGVSASLTGSTWRGKGLDLRTMNGGVSLTIPRGYNGRLETGTTNGGMRVDFPITVQGLIGKRIQTQLGTGGPLVRVVTTNGGVRISGEVGSPVNACGGLALPHIFPGTPTVSGNADRRKAEQERRRILRQAERGRSRRMRARLDAERKKERSAHHNKCPRCGADLKEQHVEHVKIDECQDCGGVWLDRGELDQLGRVNQSRGVSGGVLGSLFKRR